MGQSDNESRVKKKFTGLSFIKFKTSGIAVET